MKTYPGPLVREDVDSPDKTYQALRLDHPVMRERREFVESLWSKYWPFADDDFYRDFPLDTVARFWEMDLACNLTDLGFQIEERRAHGPDVCAVVDGRRVWIEAIAPTSGDGPDAVSGLAFDGIARGFLDGDNIVLRLRSAIEVKTQRRKEYVADGIVTDSDPYVIAINGCKIGAALVEQGIPYIVKAVYPVGDVSWRIDLATEAVTELPPAHRPAIEKASGSAVATTCFLDAEYAGISGVLYSRSDVANRRDDWRFVHNQVAVNQLPQGWLKVGKGYWPGQDGLEITRHSGRDD